MSTIADYRHEEPTCASCHYPKRPETRFCFKCGAPAVEPEQVTCPYCATARRNLEAATGEQHPDERCEQHKTTDETTNNAPVGTLASAPEDAATLVAAINAWGDTQRGLERARIERIIEAMEDERRINAPDAPHLWKPEVRAALRYLLAEIRGGDDA